MPPGIQRRQVRCGFQVSFYAVTFGLLLAQIELCGSDKESESPPVPKTNPAENSSPADGHRLTFDEIASLPDDKFDVAAAVLALAAELKPEIEPAVTLDALKNMADKAKADLPENPDGQDYFDALYEFVLDRKPASPFREDRAEDYDLSYTVTNGKGSCLSTGIMVLAVSRRMGAPIWGVQCPGHFFLRYVPREHIQKDNANSANHRKHKDTPLNFDATRPTPDDWTRLDDDFYRNLLHLDAHAEARGAYMQTLTDKEVVSTFLSSRAGYFALKKDFQASNKDAARALKLNPHNITACVNLGLALESLNKLDEAEQAYNQALHIDPGYVKVLNNLAYLKVRDPASSVYSPRRAEKLIEAALKKEPDRAYLHATDAEVRAALGDWRAATRAMDQAMKIEPKNKVYRERFMYFRAQLRGEASGETAPVVPAEKK